MESLEEWKQEADALVEEVESEGIVLLKNEGEVLPLAKGNKLSLFSRSSVDLVLGGTGAGGIDPSKTVDLKTALEEDGEFEVNNTLWDFYKTYDGKDGYIRSNGSYSGALPEDIFTAEVPQSEYTDAVKASYADYNDAAVVVISRVGGEGSDMPAEILETEQNIWHCKSRKRNCCVLFRNQDNSKNDCIAQFFKCTGTWMDGSERIWSGCMLMDRWSWSERCKSSC